MHILSWAPWIRSHLIRSFAFSFSLDAELIARNYTQYLYMYNRGLSATSIGQRTPSGTRIGTSRCAWRVPTCALTTSCARSLSAISSSTRVRYSAALLYSTVAYWFYAARELKKWRPIAVLRLQKQQTLRLPTFVCASFSSHSTCLSSDIFLALLDNSFLLLSTNSAIKSNMYSYLSNQYFSLTRYIASFTLYIV